MKPRGDAKVSSVWFWRSSGLISKEEAIHLARKLRGHRKELRKLVDGIKSAECNLYDAKTSF